MTQSPDASEHGSSVILSFAALNPDNWSVMSKSDVTVTVGGSGVACFGEALYQN